jgi:glycosyltransferase involved in cell wall biosynthesis
MFSHMPQPQLVQYYQQAKVHVLPSWFETTGLSSLEAAAMGCRVVISDRGDAREYFGSEAFYCDPGSPKSIYDAVEKAAVEPKNSYLEYKVRTSYSWKRTSLQTLQAYNQILQK